MSMDPVLLAVLANRLDAIVREMDNTLLRSARSAILAMSRDFSCSIVTSDNQLLAASEAAPVHVIGSEFLTAPISKFHPDYQAGDAFLHNDPYLGNTHPADHTILVPVFHDGKHLFTACAKAHMADIGNSEPTTYMPSATDVYKEGALIFPCVQVQRDYRDISDVIRMCQRRIRVPDLWYGDYLAQIGAARIGERRMKELAERHGTESIEAFIEEWFDYSERRMAHALRDLPSGRYKGDTSHDPFDAVPDGIPLTVEIAIDPDLGMVDIDLRDNIDNVPAGLNQTQATAMASVVTGVLNSIDPDIPHNAGAFRRVRVHLREGCVAGIPKFPASCSVATTNVADRLVNVTQRMFAEINDGFGAAEGGTGLGPGFAVISGTDSRRGGEAYVNEIFIASQGGGASPWCDGWLTYLVPGSGGMMYKDSIEMVEQKYPLYVKEVRIHQDSEGAGRTRGAPGTFCVYGPRDTSMRAFYVADSHVYPPAGVRGGWAGGRADVWKLDSSGDRTDLAPIGDVILEPGEWIVGVHVGGGGYGDPLEREAEAVLKDVLEGWVSEKKAREVYGVVMSSQPDDGSLAVDWNRTKDLRHQQMQSSAMASQQADSPQ